MVNRQWLTNSKVASITSQNYIAYSYELYKSCVRTAKSKQTWNVFRLIEKLKQVKFREIVRIILQLNKALC